MTASNPLKRAREDAPSTGTPFVGFSTLDQMLDEVDRRNALPWVIDLGRWYFVVPAAPGMIAHISQIDGPKAAEMRARADGSHAARWDPEPLEMEWIRWATSEYLRRAMITPDDDQGRIRKRFSQTMNGWASGKPWRAGRDQFGQFQPLSS